MIILAVVVLEEDHGEFIGERRKVRGEDRTKTVAQGMLKHTISLGVSLDM